MQYVFWSGHCCVGLNFDSKATPDSSLDRLKAGKQEKYFLIPFLPSSLPESTLQGTELTKENSVLNPPSVTQAFYQHHTIRMGVLQLKCIMLMHSINGQNNVS